MLKSWVAAGKSGISNTRDDTMVLALHVLTAAGFGKSYDFDEASSTVTKGHTMTFGNALHTVLTRFVIVLLTSSLNLSWGPVAKILPRSLTSVQTAIAEFRQYLVEMVAEERASVGKRSDDQDNLMSALLRASDLRDAQGDGRSTLTEDEIYGNLFIYSFAGHDTTAGTLAYAIALLARDNKIQSWIKEEINFVIGSGQDETWDYEKMFPQLKRCIAIMVSPFPPPSEC
jgi:cytochrome P450